MKENRNHHGDDGTTVILGGKRLSKYHPRIETLGTLDEASATLGLARSLAKSYQAGRILLEMQKHLYLLMVEIASPAPINPLLPILRPSHLEWLDSEILELEKQVELPSHFIIPGDSLPSAALAVARTTIRRAERSVAKLIHRKEIRNDTILPWMNRASSLIFLLEVSASKDPDIEPKLAGEM